MWNIDHNTDRKHLPCPESYIDTVITMCECHWLKCNEQNQINGRITGNLCVCVVLVNSIIKINKCPISVWISKEWKWTYDPKGILIDNYLDSLITIKIPAFKWRNIESYLNHLLFKERTTISTKTVRFIFKQLTI